MNPLLAYKLLSQLDEMSKELLAPVAEYLGAALIEKPGKVDKVFQGQAYKTDGFVYLIHRESKRPGYLSLLRFPDERTVKLVLETGGPDVDGKFMSMAEVCKLLKMPVSLGPWVWNEDDERFDPLDEW